MGANDGVRRGDRAETGDLEARPKKAVGPGGSGVAGGHGGASGNPTADPSSMGGNETAHPVGGSTTDIEDLREAGLKEIDAGEAGVTGIDRPADWATETGSTRTAESGSWSATGEMTDDESTLAGSRTTTPGAPGGVPERGGEGCKPEDEKKKKR